MPRSEWQISPGVGRWFCSAMREASISSPLFRLSDMAQPTISMVAISLTAARVRHVAAIGPRTMSDASPLLSGRN
ncbi:MAG: hypothetical protein AAF967_14490 [Pseudomonadota bacterium]